MAVILHSEFENQVEGTLAIAGAYFDFVYSHCNFSNSEFSTTSAEQQGWARGLILSHIFMRVCGPARDKNAALALLGLRLTESLFG